MPPKWTFVMAQAVADGIFADFELRQQAVDEGKEAEEKVDSNDAPATAEEGESYLPSQSGMADAFLPPQLLHHSLAVSISSRTFPTPRRCRLRKALTVRRCAAVFKIPILLLKTDLSLAFASRYNSSSTCSKVSSPSAIKATPSE